MGQIVAPHTTHHGLQLTHRIIEAGSAPLEGPAVVGGGVARCLVLAQGALGELGKVVQLLQRVLLDLSMPARVSRGSHAVQELRGGGCVL